MKRGSQGLPAEASSDVRRVRGIALAASLAASVALLVAVVVGAAAPAGRLASPGPLARPHARAGLACSACHRAGAGGAASAAAAQACIGCHGAHGSTREAHRALSARGELPCASCHRAHVASGVTFEPGGAVTWTGDAERRLPATTGPAGATVPLVPLAACARCHDLARADDPVQACIGPERARFTECLDEHQTASSPLASRGACARQHGRARFVAWDATRAVLADAASAPPSARGALGPWLWVGSSVGAGGLAFAGVAVAVAARARRRRASGRPMHIPLAPAARVRLPAIDATSCLGCQACVEACPFEVLAVERHIAVVARPDECCGVGSCEQACPNGSLRLLGEGEPLGGRPRVDAHLESADAPGVFVAGDLTGVPLIRNAIAQGARVADRVAEKVRSAGGAPSRESFDLAVVGAGPAGLSAALRARELGLSCVVLEQSTLAASIRAFPRGKIVHDPPIELPLEGALWLRECTKEELVAHWIRIARAHRLEVREGQRVTGVTRAAQPGQGSPRFAVHTAGGGPAVRAAHLLLATGRRGTPRRLPAEIAPSVASRVLSALSDARALAGRRVLVVGLGDSAMEAIVALERQPGTTVTISYRGAGFARGRARNVERVQRLLANGRVRIVFESHVARVDERGALLRTPAGDQTVEVDVVLALLGGEPSRTLLQAAGVRLEGE